MRLANGLLAIQSVTLLACRFTTTTVATATKMADTTAQQSGYVPGSASIAYVTAPDETVAKTLAHGLINGKLAACINIIPKVLSIYRWEGKITEDSEVMMMIKTETSRINEVTQYIREHHPYTVAEVISVPIENGNPPYMDFITKALT